MKTICPLIFLGCGLLWNSAAVASVNLLIGPATVSLSCAAQDLNYDQVSAKTNLVGSKTNVTLVLKSTVTNFTLNASSLLDLLANSYSTNFPSGAKLLLRGESGNFSLDVSDSTGTNIYMYTGSVLNPDYLGEVNAGMETESTTNQTYFSGNDTEAFTSAISLQYDDGSMTTTDGTRTFFNLNCLVQTKQSRNLGTDATTENVTMTVTGGGQIRSGPQVIITGTVRGTTAGIFFVN